MGEPEYSNLLEGSKGGREEGRKEGRKGRREGWREKGGSFHRDLVPGRILFLQINLYLSENLHYTTHLILILILFEKMCRSPPIPVQSNIFSVGAYKHLLLNHHSGLLTLALSFTMFPTEHL